MFSWWDLVVDECMAPMKTMIVLMCPTLCRFSIFELTLPRDTFTAAVIRHCQKTSHYITVNLYSLSLHGDELFVFP